MPTSYRVCIQINQHLTNMPFNERGEPSVNGSWIGSLGTYQSHHFADIFINILY